MALPRGRGSGGRAGRLAVGLAVACAALLGVESSAAASVTFTAAVNFSGAPTPGETGVASTLTVRNASTGLEALLPLTVGGIALVPSCGSQTIAAGGDCPMPSVDPGVLRPSANGTGRFGTGCTAVPFTISLIDAGEGKYNLPVASHADKVALCVLAALIVRMLGETPRRTPLPGTTRHGTTTRTE